ncbi:phosphoribosyltransferase family protein [Asticcacaulis sp. EMRT-3]|uniref:phosphoribosyltransferase n=1 Tax=Asticcacaulis sp. EMRT-3 TaxID=3040349 RepID=UPI0024AEF759|nr:phosphoribosyltransferase family protein [Asticcacaulis sp. EMRT-3]MDI7776044.1 phosphoribosyltransferase family protein [Asticcacaulis sp. EMRT-3]
MTQTPALPPVLLSEDEVQTRVEVLADLISHYIRETCVGVCLLTGGLWFSADLSRALNKRGSDIAFDALWLSSYGDVRESGTLLIRAPLQRSVAGRQVLIMDDVLDTGASLKIARDIALEAGAAEVLTCVFARKPDPLKNGQMREIDADFSAWEAPARYLVGYGLDDAGRYRALPYIGALD